MNQRPVWPPFSLNTPQPLGQRHALAPRPIRSIFASHPGHQALSKIPILSPHNAFPFWSYSIPQFGQNHPPGVDPPSMVLLQSGQCAGNAASRTLDQKLIVCQFYCCQINIMLTKKIKGSPLNRRVIRPYPLPTHSIRGGPMICRHSNIDLGSRASTSQDDQLVVLLGHQHTVLRIHLPKVWQFC